ncbi:hypothetical protein Q3G72_011929 [Acer saccharum]|nr:hypothetical protein Q3G72_011929 [Acer saccharum]
MTLNQIHFALNLSNSSSLLSRRRGDITPLTAGMKPKEDLAAATSAVEVNSLSIQELMYKIREIKTKAEQSETMIQEICRDIKKLDFAKKHITTTITALHRLTVQGCKPIMEKFKTIKQLLKSHVFSDFSSLCRTRREDANGESGETCLVGGNMGHRKGKSK